MTLEQFLAVHINPRATRISTKHGRGIVEIQSIMRPVLAERDNGGEAGATSAGTAGTLLVVFTHRGDITQADGGK